VKINKDDLTVVLEEELEVYNMYLQYILTYCDLDILVFDLFLSI